MTDDNGAEQLLEEQRKQIFLAIVDAQDQEIDVAQSRKQVVQRFGVSESQVRQIEREGIENQWPPL
jgi:DNA-directed RNA polymerase specialized sigma subunit